MKNYYLIISLFFLLFSGTVGAQWNVLSFPGPKVVPFEDYSKCQVGFLSTGFVANGIRSKDTVYQARFENLKQVGSFQQHEIYSNQEYRGLSNELSGWILSENNKFGFITGDGEISIPFQYDKLEYTWESSEFLAWKNGKCGLITVKDSIIVPCAYDVIYPGFIGDYGGKTISIEDHERFGVYSRKGKEIVPPVFQSIEPIEVHGAEENQLFFVVAKDSVTGLIDEDGNWVVPLNYRSVAIINQNSPAKAISFFSASDSIGYSTVFDEMGRQICDPILGTCYPIYSRYIDGMPSGTDFIFIRDTSGTRQGMLSTYTGKHTPFYEHINMYRNRFFFGTNGYWEGMMDTSFNVIVETTAQRKLYYFECYNQRLREIQNYHELGDTEPSCLEASQVKRQFGAFHEPIALVIALEKERIKLRKKDFLSEAEYLALWNLETGRQTPFIYNEIHRMFSRSDGVYFWAVHNHSEEVRYKHQDVGVDIYDSLGILINSICLDAMEYQMAIDLGREYAEEVLLVKNDENEWSVMLMDGTLLSRTYLENSHDYQYKAHIWKGLGKHAGIIRVNVPNGFWFMDYQGKRLLDGRMFLNGTMRQLSDGLMHMKTREHYVVVRNDLSLVTDSCSDVVQLDNEARNTLRTSVKQAVIKEGIAYAVFNDTLRVMDASCFTRSFTRQRLCKGTWIDSLGNVIPGEENEQSTDLFYKDLFIGKRGDTLTIRNNDHELILEVPKVKEHNITYEGIRVVTTTGKVGLIGFAPLAWEIQPMYSEVWKAGSNGLFFARDSIKEKWCIVDSLGIRRTERIFDDPFTFLSTRERNYFYSNRKMGIIDQNFTITVPARYDSGIQLRRSYALKDSEGLYLVGDSSGTVFQMEDGFVDSDQFNRYLYVRNDSVWVRDRNGNLLLPPTPRSIVLKEVNLAKMLIPEMRYSDRTRIQGMFLSCSDSNSAVIQLNTALLLNYANRCILDQVGLRRTGKTDYKPEWGCFRHPIWVNEHYYSEHIQGKCMIESGYEKQQDWYKTFELSGDSAIAINWRDLYVNPAEAETEISLLIEKQIQQLQLFGTTCGDMPGAVAEIKRTYYIYEGNLYFMYLPKLTPVIVSFNQVKSPLKHPEYLPIPKVSPLLEPKSISIH